MTTTRPLGAQISHALKARGVEVIFGIPGVHNVELYRGINEAGLTHILTRHEQGAGFMADGYARATGKPGVAFVITGPGLTNILTPLGQAYSDSVSVLAISSCLVRKDRSIARGRLHEMLDQEGAAGCVTAWSKTAPGADEAYLMIDKLMCWVRQRKRHLCHATCQSCLLQMAKMWSALQIYWPVRSARSLCLEAAPCRPVRRFARLRENPVRWCFQLMLARAFSPMA